MVPAARGAAGTWSCFRGSSDKSESGLELLVGNAWLDSMFHRICRLGRVRIVPSFARNPGTSVAPLLHSDVLHHGMAGLACDPLE